jgi:hypothetical protein
MFAGKIAGGEDMEEDIALVRLEVQGLGDRLVHGAAVQGWARV